MIFIFDLDDTLYEKNEGVLYNPQLNVLLKQLKLKGKLIIFTNNSKSNCNKILTKMKLKSMFDKIYSDGMKPNHLVYKKINEDIKKKNKTGKVIFFDDKKENLSTAKYYNWTPIHITSKLNTNYSNYKFNSIYRAIKKFI